MRETYGYLSLPVWVRPNTVLPIGAREDIPDYDFAEDVTLHLYALEDGSTVITRLPNLRGETEVTFTTTRTGSTYSIARVGTSKPWQVLLVGNARIADLNDATISGTPDGILVKLDQDTTAVEIQTE